MSDDLTEFLLARIAEDEKPATEVLLIDRHYSGDATVTYAGWTRLTAYPKGGRSSSTAPGAPTPARVLAECEAKRRIVKWFDPDPAPMAGRTADEPYRGPVPMDLDAEDAAAAHWKSFDEGAASATDDDERYVLGALALPYADHPDFREEWRP